MNNLKTATVNGKNITNAQFKKIIGDIGGHYDKLQSALEFAVFHIGVSGNKTPMMELMQAFTGTNGKLKHDGKLIAAYVNRFVANLKISADKGAISIDHNGDGKPKDVAFKAYDAKMKLKFADISVGFPRPLNDYRLAEETKQKAAAAEKRKAAKAAKAGQTSGKATTGGDIPAGSEQAPDPTTNTKGDVNAGIPMAAALQALSDAKHAIASGNAYSAEIAEKIEAELKILGQALQARASEEKQKSAKREARNAAEKRAAESEAVA